MASVEETIRRAFQTAPSDDDCGEQLAHVAGYLHELSGIPQGDSLLDYVDATPRAGADQEGR